MGLLQIVIIFLPKYHPYGICLFNSFNLLPPLRSYHFSTFFLFYQNITPTGFVYLIHLIYCRLYGAIIFQHSFCSTKILLLWGCFEKLCIPHSHIYLITCFQLIIHHYSLLSFSFDRFCVHKVLFPFYLAATALI
jgi:hypothetical protein